MDASFVSMLPRFAKLSSDGRDLLDHVLARQVRQVDQRSDIVRENEPPEAMIMILSGWASRYKVLADGRRQIMAIMLPGDLCDLNVFLLDRRDHALGALTPVTVAEISREGYGELMRGEPPLLDALWKEALVTSAIQREWALNLGQRDAFERMAHLFCELFARLQEISRNVGNACEMPLTQAELGEATGMSSVHINRTLQELRAANLIKLAGKVLTIPDMDALQRVAQFNPNYLHLEL